ADKKPFNFGLNKNMFELVNINSGIDRNENSATLLYGMIHYQPLWSVFRDDGNFISLLGGPAFETNAFFTKFCRYFLNGINKPFCRVIYPLALYFSSKHIRKWLIF